MISNPADLADNVAPLAEDEMTALHAYWDQVLDEMWGVSAPVVAVENVVGPTAIVLDLQSTSSVRAGAVSGEAA